MKSYAVFCALLLSSFISFSQVTLQTNLPWAMSTGVEDTFDLRIIKGRISGFSKLSIELPPGMMLREIESQSGTFSITENTTRITWALTPETAVLNLRMGVTTPTLEGSKEISFRYFYNEGGNKKELQFEPMKIDIRQGATDAADTSYITLTPVVPAALPNATLDVSKLDLKNPQELKAHAAQLKRDAREATKVGEYEKKKALMEAKDADDAAVKAAEVKDPALRQRAVSEAEQAKIKAENDRLVAEKILALAKTLEDNANEIEKLVSTQAASQKTTTSSVPDTAAAKKITAKSSENEKDIEKLKDLFSEKKTPAASDDLVYHVQVGAFSNKPAAREFSAMGKVNIVNENGLYKVLVGNYSQRDDAVKKKEQLAAKGIDGFIVTYKNGSRVK